MYYDVRCSEDVQLASLPSKIATELDEEIFAFGCDVSSDPR